MTQLEKDLKLADLKTKQQMLEDDIRALEAAPVTTYKVWEPEYQEWYHLIFSHERYKNNSNYDQNLISIGLAHPTKEAAERHHSFLVMLHDLHKFAVEHNEGWKPEWGGNVINWTIIQNINELHTEGFQVSKLSVLPYFKNERLAQKAIDTFGDRLKILFEYYNS